MKTLSTFNKSVLSIVIISAATVSFISWDKYQPRHETASLVEFYESGYFDNEAALLHSLVENDSATLARIAEDNLGAQARLISDAIIEDNDIIDDNFASDDNYASEENETVAYQAASEQVVLWSEEATTDNNSSDIVIANKVLFDFDSSDISAEYFASLNETAKQMQAQSEEQDMVWQVVGYADRSGNFIYNSKLARKRANQVAQYLINKGVNEDQLAIISLGTSNPPNETRSIENNRNERRVEIHEYQAEVTALLQQYNQYIKQGKQPSSKAVQLDTESESLVEVDKSQAEKLLPAQSTPTLSFKKAQAASLTTAMEL